MGLEAGAGTGVGATTTGWIGLHPTTTIAVNNSIIVARAPYAPASKSSPAKFAIVLLFGLVVSAPHETGWQSHAVFECNVEAIWGLG